eukprot:TRINITY_DN94209_c0_g1_i1.p1 TRINITY_DN94209_c0_g1~~TRINITY_DN94209_c0_g1_i1.p1  ORF type:complete len:765 (+),score=156.75 TRINITY_DN94209_c0_g1_i1:145-2295(+)
MAQAVSAQRRDYFNLWTQEGSPPRVGRGDPPADCDSSQERKARPKAKNHGRGVGGELLAAHRETLEKGGAEQEKPDIRIRTGVELYVVTILLVSLICVVWQFRSSSLIASESTVRNAAPLSAELVDITESSSQSQATAAPSILKPPAGQAGSSNSAAKENRAKGDEAGIANSAAKDKLAEGDGGGLPERSKDTRTPPAGDLESGISRAISSENRSHKQPFLTADSNAYREAHIQVAGDKTNVHKVPLTGEDPGNFKLAAKTGSIVVNQSRYLQPSAPGAYVDHTAHKSEGAAVPHNVSETLQISSVEKDTIRRKTLTLDALGTSTTPSEAIAAVRPEDDAHARTKQAPPDDRTDVIMSSTLATAETGEEDMDVQTSGLEETIDAMKVSASIIEVGGMALRQGAVTLDRRTARDITADWGSFLDSFPGLTQVYRLGRLLVNEEQLDGRYTAVAIRVAIANTGMHAWPLGTSLSVAVGQPMGVSFLRVGKVEPGHAVNLTMQLQVPGTREAWVKEQFAMSIWTLTMGEGLTFGPLLVLEIQRSSQHHHMSEAIPKQLRGPQKKELSASLMGEVGLELHHESLRLVPSSSRDVTLEWATLLSDVGVEQAYRLGRILVDSGKLQEGFAALTVFLRLKNTGKLPWPHGTVLQLVMGEALGMEFVSIDGEVKPSAYVNLMLQIQIPAGKPPGHSRERKESAWGLQAGGRDFGVVLLLEVERL